MNSWADLEEDGENPSRGDDEYSRAVDEKTGIITESFIRTEESEDGPPVRIRVTKKFTETKKPTRVNRHVQARRRWSKFGDCAGVPAGPEPNVTYQQPDTVELEFLKAAKPAGIKDEVKITTTCRKCGQSGHWTLQCKLFATDGKEDELDVPKRMPQGVKPSGPEPGEIRKTANGKEAYRPPRPGFGGGGPGGRDDVRAGHEDVATLRVTNLSEDTTVGDLQQLFGTFGHTTRVFLAKDRNTNMSRGFAFINYANRHDAQAAIDKLNGHGYDSLILHVEWAKPREEKPDAAGGDGGRIRAVQDAQRRRF